MELCLIWACDKNNAIGKDNKLPWNLPEDLANFKSLTESFPVIMGRKTWESLPNGALLNRQNIVVSENNQFTASKAVVVPTFQKALELAGICRGVAKCFVIGGSQLFNKAINVADVIYVTEIESEVEAPDCFAPEIPPIFKLTQKSNLMTSKTGLQYSFKTYKRIGRCI